MVAGGLLDPSACDNDAEDVATGAVAYGGEVVYEVGDGGVDVGSVHVKDEEQQVASPAGAVYVGHQLHHRPPHHLL